MSLELFNKHVCKEQSLKRDCPVCSDMLFESKHPVKVGLFGSCWESVLVECKSSHQDRQKVTMPLCWTCADYFTP